ncbi:MAG: thiamine-phosphate kinase [Bacteroidetes bacterium]|nr:thiamine-phosphate kinase [Bacteroidota bacterium]MBT5530564.1 thiamine-phosphate kinase [Cytophagia bacterium]MBT5992267.1 thiamine-phosphate kinase [Bacteroidota bacterium]
MLSEITFTPINELGEFGLIDRLTEQIQIQNASSIKAGGDDCAVIDYKNKQTLVSTDMLVSNVHFDLLYTPLQHLGYKSIIAGISDIYAMNGMAEQVVVSIAISNQFSIEMLDLLFSGMLTACEQYKVDFVGGDTTTIDTGLVINVTAMGHAAKKEIVYRDGAKKNDILCVSGDLGASYVGLLILEREKQVFLADKQMQPKLEGYDYVLKRQLRPEARIDVVKELKALGVVPTSMIDISDGLSSEILHISKQSKLGCKLFEEKIPIDPTTYNTARELNLDPTTCALSGGEDYELLFTVSAEEFEKLKDHPDFTPIGHMTDLDFGCKMISKSGYEHELKAQGWKVFGAKEGEESAS